ncbi:MAG: hypothetical protein DRJ05_04025, partial [Bacteroidetes bacterium]
MKHKSKILTLIFSIILLGGYTQGVHHKLTVDLDVRKQSITVVDKITFPVGLLEKGEVLTFSLNQNLTVDSQNDFYMVTEIKPEDNLGEFKTYSVTYPPSKMAFLEIPLVYSGKIADEIAQGAAEYARGFSETDGMIGKKGVYLAGSTYWIPSFEEPLFTYD